MDEPSAPTPLHEQTHTADAGVLPATKALVTMSDASAPDGNASEDAAAGAAPTIAANLAERAEIAAADVRPVETTSSEAAAPEIGSAVADAAEKAGTKPEEAQAPAQMSSDAASTEASASDGINTGATKAEPKAGDVIIAAPKADASGPDEKSSEKPDENVKPAVDVSTSTPDANRDPTRLPDTAKPSKPDPAMAAAPKRTGQISVFISRKDSKLYVRQNFAPLFEVPVTIAPSDRPLGTHVFTAQVDSHNANVLHWSVVSLPAPTRRGEDERASRRRKIAGAAEIKPIPVPDSPAEALDRLTIPADAMARITDALSTGGSIIVSDQGIAGGETGEGTDFIVSLR